MNFHIFQIFIFQDYVVNIINFAGIAAGSVFVMRSTPHLVFLDFIHFLSLVLSPLLSLFSICAPWFHSPFPASKLCFYQPTNSNTVLLADAHLLPPQREGLARGGVLASSFLFSDLVEGERHAALSELYTCHLRVHSLAWCIHSFRGSEQPIICSFTCM